MLNIDEMDFLSHLSTKQRLSKGTITTRKSRYNIYYKWIKGNNKELNSQSTEQFFYYLQNEKKLTNSALNTYYHALNSLQKYLTDRGHNISILNGFQVFKQDEPYIEKLTNEEIELLIKCRVAMKTKHLQKVYDSLTLFLIYTGARWEDARDIECRHVDLTGGTVTFEKTKTGKIRRVYILHPITDILQDLIKDRNGLIFTNSCGGQIHYGDYYCYLKKRAVSCGIKKRVSPHVLRHSYAESLYDEKEDIYLVRDVLGHRSVRSTESYVRNSSKRIRTAMTTHPYLAKEQTAISKIEQLKERILESNIEKDPRFDYIKVQQAIKQFSVGLYGAILTK